MKCSLRAFATKGFGNSMRIILAKAAGLLLLTIWRAEALEGVVPAGRKPLGPR